MEIKELTRAEEEVMQILWRLKKGFIKEILEKFDEPRPAYSTVSTIIRILQDKGFVNYRAYCKDTPVLSGHIKGRLPQVADEQLREGNYSNCNAEETGSFFCP
ncbi:MAG: BlaI/MecI/CopY family transcriptional regulator [Bacteroidales bacterium]|nr:BlaI/MecI/CopY family transcriptional regulator [Bacteroidales bacterium]